MLLAPSAFPRLGISGSPGAGNRLTAVVPDGLAGDFVWKADGVAIAGATLPYYDQLSTDADKTIVVELHNWFFVSDGIVSRAVTGSIPAGALLLDGQPILLDGNYVVLA